MGKVNKNASRAPQKEVAVRGKKPAVRKGES